MVYLYVIYQVAEYDLYSLDQDCLIQFQVKAMLYDVFNSVKARAEHDAAVTIQKYWLRCYYDPCRTQCKKRLRRECQALTQDNKRIKRDVV